MTAGDAGKDLSGLLKKLDRRYADASAAAPATTLEPGETLLGELVWSVLHCDAPAVKAAAAMKRIEGAVVDFNELRVCLPDELASLLGERYPGGPERASALRGVLNAIYKREHAVTLEHLRSASKRDAKAYLDQLPGLTGFASARIMLVQLGGHACPIDGRILANLRGAKVFGDDATVDSAAAFIERQVRAGDLLAIYAKLQAWTEDGEPGGARRGAGRRAAAGESRARLRRPKTPKSK